MKFEFSLMNMSIEEYENGAVKRLMNRCGKIAIKEIVYTDTDKYYRYIWLVKDDKTEMAKEIMELLTTFDIL